MANSNEALEMQLKEILPLIDGTLAETGVPIHKRVFTSACHFVEYFIVEVSGDTKEDFLLKPWFSVILQSVNKWYENRYGIKHTHPSQFTVLGLISHFDTPFLIRVPLAVRESNEDGTAWVHFPIEVLPMEKPFEWVDIPVANLKENRRGALLKSIISTATSLRTIRNDLNTADNLEPSSRLMCESIIRHLEKAAEEIVAEYTTSRSLAVWELQMACEKVIKVYLSQKAIAYPSIHDLRELQKLAMGDSNLDCGVVVTAMGNMPSEQRVMKWRYLEIPPPTPKDVERFYSCALLICSFYASRMSRQYVLKNFAVQLQRPLGIPRRFDIFRNAVWRKVCITVRPKTAPHGFTNFRSF